MKFTVLVSVAVAVFLMPFQSFAASTVFKPTSCPAEKDLATHLNKQVDDRIAGVTASDTTKKFFNHLYLTATSEGNSAIRNPNVWTNNVKPIDLSGISALHVGGVLISPRHVVMADHYRAGIGATIHFIDNNNNVVTRKIVAFNPASNWSLTGGIEGVVSGDIAIGLLDADVPPSVTYYPVIAQEEFFKYLSIISGHALKPFTIPMLVVDQEWKALITDIDHIRDIRILHLVSTIPARKAFNERLIAGDSGKPAFVIIDGKPVLMLTHGSPADGYYYGTQLDYFNDQLAQLGGGYEFSSYDLSCFNRKPAMTITKHLPEYGSLNKYAPVGTVIATVSATDPEGGLVTYSITSDGGSGAFLSIDPSGQLKVSNASSLRSAWKISYTLVIRATDNAAPIPAYNEIVFEFHIDHNSVPPVNTAPVVNAGTDRTITVSSVAQLSGNVSDDGKPNGNVTLTWSKISGPGTVTFSNATAASTIATFGSAGSYTLKLTANDGALSAVDNVNITVAPAGTVTPPQPPVTPSPPQPVVPPSIVPLPPAPSPTATSSPLVIALISNTLTYGSKGEEVRALQTLLKKDVSVYPEGTISGTFDQTTEAAVKRFQVKYGVVPTVSSPGAGTFGPKSRAKLYELYPPGKAVLPASTQFNRYLGRGSQGSDVVLLQQFLIADPSLGYLGNATGYFGPVTETALKKFQLKHGIIQSLFEIGAGSVGPRTRIKLNSMIQTR